MSEQAPQINEQSKLDEEAQAYQTHLARTEEVRASNRESKERYIREAGPKEVMDGLMVAVGRHAIVTEKLSKELEGGKTHSDLDSEIHKHVQEARGITATRTMHEEWSKLDDNERPSIEEYVSNEWHNLPTDEEGNVLDKQRANTLGLAEEWLEGHYDSVMGDSWLYTRVGQEVPKPGMKYSLGSPEYQGMANYVQQSEWNAQKIMNGGA